MSVPPADEACEAAAAAIRGHKRGKRRRPALEDARASPRRCPPAIIEPPLTPTSTNTRAPSQDQRQQQHIHDTSGPKAALVLSEWLGNALICLSALSSPHRDSHVSLLGLLLQADAALPRHTALIVACLEQSPDRRVRLEAVGALAGLTLDNVKDYLPVLAARLAIDSCAKVRMAVVTTLSGRFVASSQPYVPLVLACLEDVSAPVRRAATQALVRLGDAGLLTPQDIDGLGHNLFSRSSAVREGSMQVLCALLYLTRTCFRAKRLLEAPLWEQHDAVASLAVAREACPAVRVLGLQFLTDLPRHLCAQHVSIVVQRLGDARPGAREAALTFLQRNLDPDLLRRHVPALLQHLRPSRPRSSASSSSSSFSTSLSSVRCELTVLKCLYLVPELALEPFVNEIVAAVKAVKEEEEEEEKREGDNDKQQQTYSQSVQSAAVDVLGRMRTAVVLPLLETTLMVWVFGALRSPPGMVADAVVVRQAMKKLQSVRNAEVTQACLARLVARLREGGREGNNQARILMLLSKLGPRVVHTHAATIVSLLQNPTTSPRLRHEALKALLVLPSAQLSTHVHAIVKMLCLMGKEGKEEGEEEKDQKQGAHWRTAAVEVLRHREKDKVALVYLAVREAAEKEEVEKEEEEEEEEVFESDKENEGRANNKGCLRVKEEIGKHALSTKETRALLLEALAAVVAPAKVLGADVVEEVGREEAAPKTSARRTRRRSPTKTKV